ncbi:MAG: hypothetical protein OXE95_08835 [Chloroflexi bacterium]|nr:hypothetical protein [Chloroflexota bacterium]MCY4247664.1 hypothetical protein [Chloroflexota bacterium]
MPIDSRDYKNLTDYLQHLYQCQPFERGGIEHPVTVLYPEIWQVDDVDSLLAPPLPKPEARDFAMYDYAYLHDLQNSKPRLFNGATFTLKQIRQQPLRLRGALGSYFDMLATCAALERELRHAAEQGWMRAPSRSAYHRQVPPEDALLRGIKRSAAIGIGTLTVCNDAGVYKAIMARRSQHTAYDSGMLHVLPAMMFCPTTRGFHDAREWSLRHQITREFLEELFGLPEERQPASWDFFYEAPALQYLNELLAAGKAALYATGIIINLLTLRPEVGTLLLIHDPAWHARVTAPDSDMPLRTAAETLEGSIVRAPIATDEAFLSHFPPKLHLRMPAQATATMWLGMDMARQLIQQRQDSAIPVARDSALE